MKKFRVKTSELKWFNAIYEIEAESEDEIYDIDYSGLQEGFISEDYDCVEQFTIEEVEEIHV